LPVKARTIRQFVISLFRPLGVLFIVVTVFALAGCGQGYKKLPAGKVKIETDTVMADYVSRAIKATGSLQAWTEAKRLKFDCLVTSYQTNDSFYLTKMNLEICPWSNSIRISAAEPQGKFVWQLSKGSFSVLEGAGQIDALQIAVSQHGLAEAILAATTAPIRFLDESVAFTKATMPVKMEGKWYCPIERTVITADKSGIEPYWSEMVFCQNTDNSLVDIIWLSAGDAGESLVVRGYNYSELGKGGVLFPSKIEIFRANAGGLAQRQLIKIDIK